MDPPNSDSNSGWNPEISTTMSEAFYRLRWSVFEPISHIRVADSPYGMELSPFENHPIAAEPATKDPIKSIAFTILTLNEFESLLDEGETSEEESDYGDVEEDEESDEDEPRYYRPPKRLIVRREDGGIVTVGDVVEQLSPYIMKRKEKILESRIGFITMIHAMDGNQLSVGIPAQGSFRVPADTRVAFEGFEGTIRPSANSVKVELWAEGEDSGKSLEEHWNYRSRV